MAKGKKSDATFGVRLKALRQAKDLSQEDLGALCEPTMRGQAIARLEGDGRTPSWDTVLRLAKALGVTPNDFLSEDE